MKEKRTLREFAGNLIRSGMPPDDDSLELYQITRLNLAIIALVAFVPIFASIYLFLNVTEIAVGTFVTGLSAIFCFLWFRKSKNVTIGANFLLLIYALLVLYASAHLGGINSSVLWWNTHLPVLAVLLLNIRWASLWTSIVISEMLFLIYAHYIDILPTSPLFGSALLYHDSVTKIVAIALLFVFGILFILEKAKTSAKTFLEIPWG